MKAATWLRGATTGAALALLVACGTTATSGTGSPGATSSAAPVPDGTTTTAPSETFSTATSSSPSATPTAQLVTTIAGSGTLGGSYQMSLWAKDVITDCGAHSYGNQIIAYFAAHPCRSATRRLWTVPISGRTLAISIVSVSAQVTKVNENPDFGAAQQLVDLENADGTGSVNDLLRDGSHIPGTGTSIPSTEVFSVLSQDGLVVIMDVWYVTGTTNSKDANLTNIEADLSFSDAAAPDAD